MTGWAGEWVGWTHTHTHPRPPARPPSFSPAQPAIAVCGLAACFGSSRRRSGHTHVSPCEPAGATCLAQTVGAWPGLRCCSTPQLNWAAEGRPACRRPAMYACQTRRRCARKNEVIIFPDCHPVRENKKLRFLVQSSFPFSPSSLPLSLPPSLPLSSLPWRVNTEVSGEES